MRAGRSTSGTSYSYVYNGNQLSQMTVDNYTLQFRYSATGTPMAVICNGTYYYYITNIQGDVIGIVDTLGNTVVTYAYDAWGNILGGVDNTTVGLADMNPLRYRGYVYDDETGLYYLQSRYYNPEIGRFISADDVSYLGADGSVASYNLFAYCNNNPVMYADPTGELSISLTILGLIIGAVIGGSIGGVVSYNIASENGAEGWELFGWTMLGALGGSIVGGTAGAGIGALVTKATGVLGFSIVKRNFFVVTETMVLGHYGYTTLGASLGYGYYQISEALYNSLTDAQRWAMNSQFLKDCYNLGANFIVEPNRVIAPYGVERGSWLYYEINFLLENGYKWLEDLSALVR